MNRQELYKRILKYLAICLIVFLNTIYISQDKLSGLEITSLAMLTTIGIGFLDLYFPSFCVKNI